MTRGAHQSTTCHTPTGAWNGAYVDFIFIACASVSLLLLFRFSHSLTFQRAKEDRVCLLGGWRVEQDEHALAIARRVCCHGHSHSHQQSHQDTHARHGRGVAGTRDGRQGEKESRSESD